MNQFLLLCTAFIFMFLFTIIAEQNASFFFVELYSTGQT